MTRPSLNRSFTIKHAISLPLRRHSYTQSQLATSVKRHLDLIPYLARGSLGTRARARAVDARSTFLITDITRNATALGSLIRPRAVTRCNLAVSDMYMRDFGKTHQIAYTYCSVGISDLKPLTGTSADQLPHRKSQSLATA